MSARDEAVQAAWKALRGGHTDSLDEAARAVDAAAPILLGPVEAECERLRRELAAWHMLHGGA